MQYSNSESDQVLIYDDEGTMTAGIGQGNENKSQKTKRALP